MWSTLRKGVIILSTSLVTICLFLLANRQEIEELEEKYKEQEKEWQEKQDILEEKLAVKQEQLVELQEKLTFIRQTVSRYFFIWITAPTLKKRTPRIASVDCQQLT